jgi:hypothetical protein
MLKLEIGNCVEEGGLSHRFSDYYCCTSSGVAPVVV